MKYAYLFIVVLGHCWALPVLADTNTVTTNTVTTKTVNNITKSTVSNTTANSITGAQRIIALSPHSVELLYALGAGDRIVGTSEFADYPEQAKLIPRIGSYHNINIEKMLELEPDLLILWDSGNNQADVARIESLGVRTYRSEPKTLNAIADELERLGVIVGMQQEGKTAAAAFRQRLQQLRDQYQQRPTVTFFYQIWANPLKGMSSSSWVNEVMEGCGGRNVLVNPTIQYPAVSLENILALAPQTIIQPSQHGSDQWRALDWNLWTEIPAVANGHVFEIDGNILHRFTTRVLDGMETVCKRLEQARAHEKT